LKISQSIYSLTRPQQGSNQRAANKPQGPVESQGQVKQPNQPNSSKSQKNDTSRAQSGKTQGDKYKIESGNTALTRADLNQYQQIANSLVTELGASAHNSSSDDSFVRIERLNALLAHTAVSAYQTNQSLEERDKVIKALGIDVFA
jgi:hypothetical protein